MVGYNYSGKVLKDFDWENFDHKKVKDRVNVADKDFFKLLKDKYPEDPIIQSWKIADMKKFFKLLGEIIAETCVSHRDGFDLPQGLGQLVLISCEKPVTKDMVNYIESKGRAQFLKYFSHDTDSRICKIMYTSWTTKKKIQNRSLWTFKPSRYMRKMASDYFKSNHHIYIELGRKDKFDFYIANQRSLNNGGRSL